VQIDTFNFKVAYVCLPVNSEKFQDNYGYATGWGMHPVSYSIFLILIGLKVKAKIGALHYQNYTSDVLMQVTLPILTDQQCSSLAVYEGDIDSNKQVKSPSPS